jgi:putative heme transporter
VTQQAFTGLLTGARLLTGLVLTLLLTLIVLTDGDRMWLWLLARMGRRTRQVVGDAGQHAFWRLSGWVRGTVLIAVFHAVVVAVTMLLVGAPLVAPIAVLVFLGSFIPLVGALVFGALAVLVTFASAGLTASIVLVVVLVVDNQVEAHVLLPFLVGRYVQLHPFVVAVAVPAGAVLAGLPGTLLAVPVTAAVYAALQRVELPRDGSRPP